jgi:hypothetical protein
VAQGENEAQAAREISSCCFRLGECMSGVFIGL